MERMEQVCCGDCSKCQLPQAGQMQTMMACAIDQVFQRMQKTEIVISQIKEQVEGIIFADSSEEKPITLASIRKEGKDEHFNDGDKE